MDKSHNSSHNVLHPSSAVTFWAPHLFRLQEKQISSSVTTDSSPPDSLTDSERTLKTPNRDSAIVSNISTPLPPNCDSQSVSSADNNHKSGKSSPSSSFSSKDSGCSESLGRDLNLPLLPSHLDNNVIRPHTGPEPVGDSSVLVGDSSVLVGDRSVLVGDAVTPTEGAQSSPDSSLPGFSTRKRRSHFRAAIAELETVCQEMAQDEDLLDRAERRDLPTPHQAPNFNPYPILIIFIITLNCRIRLGNLDGHRLLEVHCNKNPTYVFLFWE
jgi:hypothetical protein